MASRFEPTLALGLALVAGWTIACAAPDGPRGRTAESDPACPAADVPPPAALGAALIEDPPLPGVGQPGWPAASEKHPHAEVGDATREEGHHGHGH